MSEIPFFKHLFIGFTVPVTFLENDFQYSGNDEIFKAFTNQVIPATTSGQTSSSQNNWEYLVYPKEKQTSLYITNLKVTLGTTLISRDDILLTTNSSLIIPMVAAVDNRQIFQPVQGYNGAFALNSEALFQFPIMKKESSPSFTNLFLLWF